MCVPTQEGARSTRGRTCRIFAVYVSTLWAWKIASGEGRESDHQMWVVIVHTCCGSDL